jgi:hypothetical protein
MRLTLILLGCSLTAALPLLGQSAIQIPQASLFERILSQDRYGDAVVKLPLTSASIGGPTERLGMLSGVPIGVEDCTEPMPQVNTPATEFVLTGMKLGQALDQLVQLDPRYMWQEVSGVIVLRPVKAWNDVKNPLNRSVGSLNWDNVTLSYALDEVATVVTGERYHTVVSPMDDRQFNVRVTNATVLDLLNSIVRAHGELVWHVGYRSTGQLREFGIGFHAFDGHARWL